MSWMPSERMEDLVAGGRKPTDSRIVFIMAIWSLILFALFCSRAFFFNLFSNSDASLSAFA
jgi:hypothetical protein